MPVLGMLFRISLVDRYIIKQLVLPWIFSLSICTILGELIGISFEQIRFITEQEFPLVTTLQVHLLKLPAFVSLSLPFSLLMATVITYSKLSRKNEIIALQSCGTRLIRLIFPALILSIIVAVLMFCLDAIIVPRANYQTAIAIENELKIDRGNLEKYQKRNIIYQEFEGFSNKRLKYLLVADYFDTQNLQQVTLLEFTDKHLSKIITANTAAWNKSSELWDLFGGTLQIIARNGNYERVNNFERLSVTVNKNLLNYVQNYRDNREMNIVELYRWLKVIQATNNTKEIRQLKVDIQQRYTLPFSCIVFAFVGAVLGCDRQIKINNITSILIIIMTYQVMQFLAASFCIAGLIPIKIGVWLPNQSCLLLSSIILRFKT